ncbi:MAG: hypothetical protein LBU53_03960 [Zoogloeaceae bacterium]|nr:hypothetical protein [Zoogloeaceae bacterium]
MPETEEMLQLFRAFYPQELSSRWATLLSLEPRRWSKIDPWKTWELLPSASGELLEVSQNLNTLLHSLPFARYAQAKAVALHCGHSSPAIQTVLLSDALCGEQAVFEGFISIVPGKLGFSINHDGGVCVLRKPGI